MGIKRHSVVLDGTRFNFSITPEQMASAIAKVDRYSVAEKIQRLDDVFAAQPAVLGAAVQLPSLGVDMKTADHAFHVLLMLFECFSEHVPTLPKIAPEAVQKSFDDIASMLKFYDGETDAEAARLNAISIRRRLERWLPQHATDHERVGNLRVLGYNSLKYRPTRAIMKSSCRSKRNEFPDSTF